MNHPLTRPSLHQVFNMEKRWARRRAVDIRGRLRDATARFEVDVTDLSTSGFRAETIVMLEPGVSVWLTLPGFAGREALVAWRSRHRYGCSFVDPLYAATVDQIVALAGA